MKKTINYLFGIFCVISFSLVFSQVFYLWSHPRFLDNNSSLQFQCTWKSEAAAGLHRYFRSKHNKFIFDGWKTL